MALVLQVREGLRSAPVAVVPLRDLLDTAGGAIWRLPAGVVAEVLRLWDDGRNTTEIAAAVGISQSAASEYVRKHRDRGAPRRPAHNGHAREVLEKHGPELRAAFEAGRSYAALAESAGIAPRTLRAYLVAESVEIKTWQRPAARAHATTAKRHGPRGRIARVREVLEGREAEIREAYEGGETLLSIGNRFGLAHITIRAVLVDQGVEIRKKNGRVRLPPAMALQGGSPCPSVGV